MSQFARLLSVVSFIFYLCFVLLAIGLLKVLYEPMVREARSSQLILHAKVSAERVESYIASRKQMVGFLSTNTAIQSLFPSPDNVQVHASVMDTIRQMSQDTPGITLLSLDARVIASEIHSRGTDFSQHDFFLTDREHVSIKEYYDSARGSAYLGVIGPAMSASGTPVGYIAFDIPLSQLGIIMNSTQNASSSETYIVNEQGVLLSDSLYVPEGALTQVIDSEGAVDCLEDLREYRDEVGLEAHEEVPERYRNYYGVEVLGTHHYVRAINACVVSEMSYYDAMKLSREANWIVFFVLLFVGLSIALVTRWLALKDQDHSFVTVNLFRQVELCLGRIAWWKYPLATFAVLIFLFFALEPSYFLTYLVDTLVLLVCSGFFGRSFAIVDRTAGRYIAIGTGLIFLYKSFHILFPVDLSTFVTLEHAPTLLATAYLFSLFLLLLGASFLLAAHHSSKV